MPHLEFRLGWIGPVEPKQAALRTLQGRRHFAFLRHAEHRERRIPQEHELAAGPQQTRRLRDPLAGIAPDRGPVLGDRKVERR